jgi:hypothetical protein
MIVGDSKAGAFIYRDGVMRLLKRLSARAAYAVNDRGDVVGLGLTTYLSISDINDAGDVVGRAGWFVDPVFGVDVPRPFIYTNGERLRRRCGRRSCRVEFSRASGRLYDDSGHSTLASFRIDCRRHGRSLS